MVNDIAKRDMIRTGHKWDGSINLQKHLLDSTIIHYFTFLFPSITEDFLKKTVAKRF